MNGDLTGLGRGGALVFRFVKRSPEDDYQNHNLGLFMDLPQLVDGVGQQAIGA